MNIYDKLLNNKKLLSVEYNPPKGYTLKIGRFENIKKFVDFINVTDSPMSVLRMNSILSSLILKNSLNVETVFNLTCRDRNVLAIQSDLLGAYALGLRNILIVNGDPSLDHMERNIYHLNTYGMLNLIERLNNGKNFDFDNIDAPTDFFVGVASNIPNKRNKYGIRKRLMRKFESGAKFVITQPVYSIEDLDLLYEMIWDINVFKIIGIFPLTSYEFAGYIDKHVHGISVPKNLLNRLKNTKDSRKEGYEFTRELLMKINDKRYLDMVNGIHLMRFNEELIEFSGDIIKGCNNEYNR